MGLMKVEKNQLFKEILDAGMDPAEFELYDEPSNTRVQHAPTDSSFKIITQGLGHVGYRGSWTVGYAGPFDFVAGAWNELILMYFTNWLNTVNVENETPDLWELLRNNEFLSKTPAHLANTPFTPDEQAQISTHLEEIKAYVKESCALSIAQAERLEARLAEVEEASRRLGRKDWILLFGGGLFSLVLSAVLPPDVVQHVLSTSVLTIGHLFSGGPSALPPQAA